MRSVVLFLLFLEKETRGSKRCRWCMQSPTAVKLHVWGLKCLSLSGSNAWGISTAPGLIKPESCPTQWNKDMSLAPALSFAGYWNMNIARGRNFYSFIFFWFCALKLYSKELVSPCLGSSTVVLWPLGAGIWLSQTANPLTSPLPL